MPRVTPAAHRALRRAQYADPVASAFIRDPTHPSRFAFPCPYCRRVLNTEYGQTQHISRTPWCLREAEREQYLPVINEIAEGLAELELEYEETLEAQHEPETSNGESTVDGRPMTPDVKATPNDIPEVRLQATQPAAESAAQEPELFFDSDEKVWVQRFPNCKAGTPISDDVVHAPSIKTYLDATGNLGKPKNFATAELLMTTGLTADGREQHLKSHMYIGQTPWESNKDLMDDIDRLPTGPQWALYEIDSGTEDFSPPKSYLFTRNIVEVILDIMADPSFDGETYYAPERHYTSDQCDDRVYGEVHTANWWWNMQIQIPDECATLVPLIVSSDPTQLSTVSGGQRAYPVVVTVGNIKKSVRRETSRKATALLAYLPVDEFDDAPNEREKQILTHNLTHRAMEIVMKPLLSASKDGVVMLCPDGRCRRGYPIVAGSVGDLKEQWMQACIMESGCPRCTKMRDGRGDNTTAPLRTRNETLAALREYFDGGTKRGLWEKCINPWWLWWWNIPYVNYHTTIMPDVLHQLYQGMVKSHLIRWLVTKIGVRRFDTYFMAMPAAEGMRHFDQGISKLRGRWTGRESREVARQLLPIAAAEDSFTTDPDLTRLARTLLEFTYRSRASRMSDTYLDRLDSSLIELHDVKEVLISEEIFEDDSRFDAIAKLHMLSHYTECTRDMGTPDNFSTEGPEHLHIEYAKKPWRASNKVRPTPQMVTFIRRYEALRIQRGYIQRSPDYAKFVNRWRGKSRVIYEEEEEEEMGELAEEAVPDHAGRSDGVSVVMAEEEPQEIVDNRERHEQEDERAEGEAVQLGYGRRDGGGNVIYPNPVLSIARKPTGCVRGTEIIGNYGATHFVHALHKYLKRHGKRKNYPTAFLPTVHHKYPVWHRLYAFHEPMPCDLENPKRDVVRARPAGRVLDRAFDVALLRHCETEFGVHRYRAGRVRTIFALPKGYRDLCSHPLVYVELFTPFSKTVSTFNGMNTTSHARTADGHRMVAVMSVYDVVMACHLAPQFHKLDDDVRSRLRSRLDLLADSRHFYHNHFYNHFVFQLVDNWRVVAAANQEQQPTG